MDQKLWRLAGAIAWAGTVGCAESDEGMGRPVEAEVRATADTTFIRNPPAVRSFTLRMDLKVGSLTGLDSLTIGDVRVMAVGARGEMIYFDNHYGLVRVVDEQGRFVRTIGRPGEGPGEYHAVFGLAAGPGGDLWLGDYDGSVAAYIDGAFVRSWLAPRRMSVGGLVANQDGTVTVLSPAPEDNGGLGGARIYVFSPDGELRDSIVPHIPWMDEVAEGRGRPSWFVAWGGRGFGAASVNSRLGFEIFAPDNGTVLRIEQDRESVSYSQGEKDDWERYNEFLRQRSGQPRLYPALPSHKPAFSDMLISRTGEIWLRLHTAAARGSSPDTVLGVPASPDWREHFEAHVFSSSGRFLFAVRGGEELRPLVASGDTVWGITRGHYGEQYIARAVVERGRFAK